MNLYDPASVFGSIDAFEKKLRDGSTKHHFLKRIEQIQNERYRNGRTTGKHRLNIRLHPDDRRALTRSLPPFSIRYEGDRYLITTDYGDVLLVPDPKVPEGEIATSFDIPRCPTCKQERK